MMPSGARSKPRWLASSPPTMNPAPAKPGPSTFSIATSPGSITSMPSRTEAASLAPEGKRAEAWRQRIEIVRQKYLEGIEELNQRSRAEFGDDFADLPPDQQDVILTMMEGPVLDQEQAREEAQAVAGFTPPEPALQQIAAEIDLDFFPLLVLHTRQGFLADPDLRRKPESSRVGRHRLSGPAVTGRGPRRALQHPSLFCRTCPRSRQGSQSMTRTKRKPDRADVCIIGAGASGATAAKVLTEAGLRVVALERGPWWKPEQFSRRRASQRPPLQPLAGPTAQSAHFSRIRRRWTDSAIVLPGASDGWRRHGPLDRLASPHDRERVPTEDDLRRSRRERIWPTGRSPTRSSSRTTTRSNGRSVSPDKLAPTSTKGRAAGTTLAHRSRRPATTRSSTRGAPNSVTTRFRHRPQPCLVPTMAGRPRTRARSPSSTATRPGPGATP